jgi:hypothetical protein
MDVELVFWKMLRPTPYLLRVVVSGVIRSEVSEDDWVSSYRNSIEYPVSCVVYLGKDVPATYRY